MQPLERNTEATRVPFYRNKNLVICIVMTIFWSLVAIFLCFSILPLNSAEDIDADEFSEKFFGLFKTYFITRKENDFLESMKADMLYPEKKPIKLIGFPVNANVRVCLKCYILAQSFIQLKKSYEFRKERAKAFMKELCVFAGIDSQNVCNGEIDINFPTADFIFGAKPNLTADHVCARTMQEYFCVRNDDTYENTITVEKPVLMGSKKYDFESTGNLTILHLTDFHYDRYYAPGSNAKCENFVCCRDEKIGSNSYLTAGAGFWGDYNACDSPGRLVENILQEIASLNRHIDVIYFTGDYVDHFSWNLTREHCKYAISFVTDLIKQYFPKTPVFPVLGNHEAYPANLFAPRYVHDDTISTKWLYEYAADQWKDWLPEDARSSLSKDGYYTVLIRPKFRLIAVNSNVCNTDNMWVIYDELYYQEQLLWLIEILSHASSSGEKVHIITHIGSNHVRCNRKWTMDLKKIVERYSHVIAGHFNGHSHIDEFVVYYANEDTALNVAWNGGSGTNFIGLNSNFKFIYIDDHTYEVIDFETWIFNLTEANIEPENKPIWYKEYSFKSFFGVKDLSPSSIDKLLKRFSNDKELLRKYWQITQKQSDVALAKGCDDNCLQEALDSITTTTFPKLKLYRGEKNERNNH